jgi:hypothetical protein
MSATAATLPTRKPPTSERRPSPRAKMPTTVAALYALHEQLTDEAKAIYDRRDAVLLRLVSAWRKDRRAPVDADHYLEIKDKFRGAGVTKCFAPAFAHRYDLKLHDLAAAD